jgi:hypothetical protein
VIGARYGIYIGLAVARSVLSWMSLKQSVSLLNSKWNFPTLLLVYMCRICRYGDGPDLLGRTGTGLGM